MELKDIIMKIGRLAYGLLVGGFLLSQLHCDHNTAEKNISPIGNWEIPINPISIASTEIIPDTLNIILQVKEDSKYHLELNQHSDKILFSSDGMWQTTDDSIYLNGTECTILDTSSDPDTLVPLDNSTCSIPIPLPYPQSETAWEIKTSNLAVLLSAFPIDSTYSTAIPQLIPKITLYKVE